MRYNTQGHIDAPNKCIVVDNHNNLIRVFNAV